MATAGACDGFKMPRVPIWVASLHNLTLGMIDFVQPQDKLNRLAEKWLLTLSWSISINRRCFCRCGMCLRWFNWLSGVGWGIKHIHVVKMLVAGENLNFCGQLVRNYENSCFFEFFPKSLWNGLGSIKGFSQFQSNWMHTTSKFRHLSSLSWKFHHTGIVFHTPSTQRNCRKETAKNGRIRKHEWKQQLRCLPGFNVIRIWRDSIFWVFRIYFLFGCLSFREARDLSCAGNIYEGTRKRH